MKQHDAAVSGGLLDGVPPGIQVDEVLGRGANGVVFAGRRDGRSVAVKVQRLSEHGVARFWREVSSMARVHHRGVPGVLDAGVRAGSGYLVMKRIEGHPLAKLVGQPQAEEDVRRWAIELSGILTSLHRRGIVHRDLSPANLVVDGNGTLHLVDFGSVAGAEGHDVAGTAHYAPPEQMGMVKRPLDARSDLYAMGAVLFELATGHPPFDDPDPVELLRKHAVEPVPPLPDVPDDLGGLIRDLLAKDMDDRPASADEVLVRLGGEPPNPVGVALPGRERELAILRHGWSRALAGAGNMVLVRGPSGMGKSRLVREAVKSASGTVWTAKCEPDDPRPLAALMDALERWLNEPGAPSVLREAAGPEGRLLLELGGPFLRHLEGPSIAGTHDQVMGAAVRMLEEVSRHVGGLIWVIDDVQWLDVETQVLLRRLAASLSDVPLLILMTARTENGGDRGECLPKEGLGKVEVITLGPLDHVGTSELVEAELGPASAEIVDHVWRRSEGHPLTAVEVLRAMLAHGVLTPREQTWMLDVERLQYLELPKNVEELILSRVRGLEGRVRTFLGAMAVAVTGVNTDRLAAVLGLEVGAASVALERAAGEGIIEPERDGSYVFLHDRLREALLSELDTTERRRLHAGWMEVLEGTDSDVHALAHHAWEAGVEGRELRVFDANVRAAEVSFERYAFDHAADLYHRAVAAAEGRLELDGRFCLRFAKACARAGRMEDANAWSTRGLAITEEPLARAEFFSLLGGVSLGRLDTTTARARVQEAMDTLGMPPVESSVTSLLRTLWALFVGLGLHWRGAERGGRRETVELEVIIQVGVCAYFQVDGLSAVQAVVRAWPLAQRGSRAEFARWSVRSATIAGAIGMHRVSRRLYGDALAVAEDVEDPVLIGFVRSYGSFATHFRGECLEAAQMARTTLERWGPMMDNFLYLTASADLTWNLLMRGHVVEAAQWIERGLERAAITPSDLTQGHTYRTYAGPVYAMLGRGAEGAEHLVAFEGIAASLPADLWRESQLLAHRLLFYVVEGKNGDEVEQAIQRFDGLDLPPSRTPLQVKHAWVARAYHRLGQSSEGVLQRAEEALELLFKAANHPTLRAHALVVQAGVHRLKSQSDAARASLQEAAGLAERTDNAWVHYEICLQRALLAEDAGYSSAARRHLEGALQVARSCQWRSRVRELRERLRGPSHATVALAGDALVRRDLEALLRIGRASVSVEDAEERTRRVLDEVLRVAGAERALLFFLRDQQLVFGAGRAYPDTSLTEAERVSRSVLQGVVESGEAIVFTGTADGPLPSGGSIQAHDLRSVAAAPLSLPSGTLGVLYVDTTLARGTFTQRTGGLLAAIATQLAFGYETARLAGLEAIVRGERQANLHLEQRVRERTDALRRSLQRLEEEVAERREAERAAHVASRAKSVFLATMSHELRTPLNAILGYSELLEDELEDAGQDDLLPDLAKIQHAGQNLLEIIDGVLDLARIEADELELHPESFDVERLFAEITVRFGDRAALRENDLVFASTSAQVYADRERLRTVLEKLVDNALQFTEGGRVELSARRSGTGVELEVRDDGAGIPEAYRERVFESFTQVDGSYTRRHGGAGMGLAIARDLVERMGGSIRMESTVGVGSRFFVLLPASAATPLHEVVPEAARPGAGRTVSQPGDVKGTT